YNNSGELFMTSDLTLAALSGFNGTIGELVPDATGFEGYVVVESGTSADSGMPETLVGLETYRNRSDIALVRAFPESARLRKGYCPHWASGGGYSTSLTLVNFSDDSQVVQITAAGLQSGGTSLNPSSASTERTLPPHGRLEETAQQLFNFTGDALI